jgi:hypothetical protein
MSALFKKGDPVRQIVQAPINGVVTGLSLDESTGLIQYRVEYQDGDEKRERYFTADQIEAAQAGE